jgi:hypothetical protein
MIYSYIHTYTHTYMYTYMHICTHEYTHACTHAYSTHACIHVSMHTHIHIYIHTYIHTYMYTHIHTYTCIHSHTWTHGHGHGHGIFILATHPDFLRSVQSHHRIGHLNHDLKLSSSHRPIMTSNSQSPSQCSPILSYHRHSRGPRIFTRSSSQSRSQDIYHHFPVGDVAKINTPWPWPWPWLSRSHVVLDRDCDDIYNGHGHSVCMMSSLLKSKGDDQNILTDEFGDMFIFMLMFIYFWPEWRVYCSFDWKSRSAVQKMRNEVYLKEKLHKMYVQECEYCCHSHCIIY